jgi:CBS domain containing-hemolysin-like protein
VSDVVPQLLLVVVLVIVNAAFTGTELALFSAAVSLAGPLEPALGFLGGAARPASIVLVTLALSFLTLVFGELAPKRIAMQRAEQWARCSEPGWTCLSSTLAGRAARRSGNSLTQATPERRSLPDATSTRRWVSSTSVSSWQAGIALLSTSRSMRRSSSMLHASTPRCAASRSSGPRWHSWSTNTAVPPAS